MDYNLVYKTTNLLNGKIYVGKHVQRDTSAFDGYLGSGVWIKRVIKKYGEENFIRETIEFVDISLLNEREIFWIAELSATDRNIGYNVSLGGDGLDAKTLSEINLRPDIKKRKSISQKARWENKDFRERTIKNMIVAQNKPLQKEKVSQAMIEYGNREETRKRRSDIMKGIKHFAAIYHYILKSPDGEIFETDCLADFCKERGLNGGLMCMVVNGQRNHHYGWTLVSKTLRGENE